MAEDKQSKTSAIAVAGEVQAGLLSQLRVILHVYWISPVRNRLVLLLLSRTGRLRTGEAEVIWEANGYPPVINNPELTTRMAPTLARVAGIDNTKLVERGMGGEDFSYFAQAVPGFFFRVGITGKGLDPREVPANHSDLFLVDESGLIVGLRAMLQLVADYSESDIV